MMRISGDCTSINYWKLQLPECPTVLLDGVAVEHVTFADSEYGIVTRELVGADGKKMIASVVLDDGRVVDKVIATEDLRGLVKILCLGKEY